MKSIAQAVGVLCISGYIMGLLMNMVQITYTQKVVRMVVAMFIIITIFKPVRELEPDSFDAIAYSHNIAYDTGQEAVQNIVSSAALQIQDIIKKRLDDKKIGYEAVGVHIYEQEGALSIGEVEISGAETENQGEIVQLIQDIAPKELINFGGNNGKIDK